MLQSRRFGRRIAIPSTRQIIHEMRMLKAEEHKKALAAAPPSFVEENTNPSVQPLR